VLSVVQPARPEPSIAVPRKEAHHPLPDAWTVDEDKQGGEQGEQEPGQDVAGGRPERQRPGDQRLAVCLNRRPCLVEVAVELGVVNVPGGAEEVAELLVRLDRTFLQVWKSAADLGDDQEDQAADNPERNHHGERDGDAFWPAARHKKTHNRHQQRRDEDRDHKRDDDQLELDDQQSEYNRHPDHREDAPRPLARYFDTQRDGRLDLTCAHVSGGSRGARFPEVHCHSLDCARPLSADRTSRNAATMVPRAAARSEPWRGRNRVAGEPDVHPLPRGRLDTHTVLHGDHGLVGQPHLCCRTRHPPAG
jgi:hypothetical protein